MWATVKRTGTSRHTVFGKSVESHDDFVLAETKREVEAVSPFSAVTSAWMKKRAKRSGRAPSYWSSLRRSVSGMQKAPKESVTVSRSTVSSAWPLR